MDIGTSGDQLAGEEESLCVLHEQVEPAACLPRQIPSKPLILNLNPPYRSDFHISPPASGTSPTTTN